MRIGVNLLFLLPSEVGGVEQYVTSLLPALAKCRPDVEFVLFTNRENHQAFESFDGVRHRLNVRAVRRSSRILAEQLRLPALVKNEKLDLLWSPGYTAPFRCACPQTVTIHDVQFRGYPRDFSAPVRAIHRLLVGGAARAAAAVITVSEFSRLEIVRHLRIDPSKVFAVHSAVPEFPEGTEPPLVEPPYILCVANAYPHKNLSALVSAIDQVPNTHTLVIVGRTGAGEPPPHPRLRRVQRVSRAELASLYRHADLFVLPSLYEGFGLPLLEALSFGVRVIASNRGAIPEVGGDAATYFDATGPEIIAKAIADALAEGAPTRAHYASRGIARAAQFSWEKSALETWAVFDHILRH